MIRNNENPQTGVILGVQSPSFKPWMRVIAFIVIFCFLYQDLASAAMPPAYTTTLNSLYRTPAPIPANPLNAF